MFPFSGRLVSLQRPQTRPVGIHLVKQVLRQRGNATHRRVLRGHTFENIVLPQIGDN